MLKLRKTIKKTDHFGFFKSVKLELYSPEQIKKDSFGEIVNPKTFTKSWKEELGGLFDPRVFGPSSNYECYCGKYQGLKNKNQKCDQCGVVVTSNKVRRWRMGHIELNAPVTNIIVLKGIISKIAKLVSISAHDIESIVYCDKYVVIKKGNSGIIENKQILEKNIDYSILRGILQEIIDSEIFSGNEKKKRELNKLIGNLDDDRPYEEKDLEERVIFVEDYIDFLENWGVVIKTGSQALLEIFKSINLEKELEELNKLKAASFSKRNLASLESINNKIRFIRSLIENDVKLENVIITRLPVIPAGLRPATKLEDDNSIATTQINNLYRRVILANNRLQSYKELNESREGGKIFSAEIIHNEIKVLQNSVNVLFQGGSQLKDDLNVKSLISMISGKEGILRKHSLGKRVDYSARSVIVPNPALKIDQTGIPVMMALVLYKPFLMREILDRKISDNVEEINLMIKREEPIIFSILNEITKNHPIVLNRAPTLHKLGIQGFYPVLIPDKSIQLYPLKTTAFNADFDGDQMAVHLPLSKESIEEVKRNIISSKNIINAQNNSLIDVPTQDMILGIYYLTCAIKNKDIKVYYSIDSLKRDYENQKLDVRELVIIPAPLLGRNFINKVDQLVFTTLGRIIINDIMPTKFPFYINDLNELVFYNKKKETYNCGSVTLRENFSIKEEFKNMHVSDGWKRKDFISFLNNLISFANMEEMSIFLDDLKDISFKFAKESGLTISLFDIPSLETKEHHCLSSQEKIIEVDDHKSKGFYTEQEAYAKKIEIWGNCKDKLEKELLLKLESSKDSSLYSIWNSGARASTENLTQIFAMRGNMTNYRGETIETAITSSLWEGLNQFEFVISVYGMIKGMIDLAVKTAVAGHFSRMLIECVQNIIVKEHDCGTDKGTMFKSLTETDRLTNEEFVIAPLEKRVYGRYLSNDVFNNNKSEILIARNKLILKDELDIIKENKIDSIYIRNSLECNMFPAICRMCYGIDLSKINELVNLGATVGIIAAQSLGEPGTQLTMRTFHSGGVSSQHGDIVQGLPKVKEILENITFSKEDKSVIATSSGLIKKIYQESQDFIIIQEVLNEEGNKVDLSYAIPFSKTLLIKEKQFINKGESLTIGKIDLNEYLEICGRDSTQEYIKKEVSKVYSSQGIDLNEKHMELFARQMLSKLKITKDFIDEDFGDYIAGDLINYNDFIKINKEMNLQGKGKLEAKQMLFGIKKVTSYFSSFISAASFQGTPKALVDHLIFQPIDKLEGLKPNIIMGQMIPSGIGYEIRKELFEREE
jgi:DNA-directed RNA polymerase subunit beta'